MGEETADLLARKFQDSPERKSLPSILEFVDFYRNISLEELQTIPDIGPKVSQSIYYWFRNGKNIKLLKNLQNVDVKIELATRTARSRKLEGKKFVLTGSLASMTRERVKERIRELGGDIAESVSKKTDYLVVGSEPGSKLDEARKLGVKILTEKEFLKIL